MPFYFKSKNHKAGNKAFNDGKYLQAFGIYTKALAELDKDATKTDLSNNQEYMDAYAYVCGEIIIATCYAMPIDYNDFNLMRQHWESIPELIEKMESNFDQLEQDNLKSTTKKTINNVYVILGKTCESISDSIRDAISIAKQNQTPNFTEEQEEVMLKHAIELMQDAVHYYTQTSEGTPIIAHLSLLNAYEALYKLKHEEIHLVRMDQLLDRPPVNFVNGDSLQRLEWLAYALSVAIKLNKKNCHELVDQCQNVLDEFDESERNDCLLITEVNELMELVTGKVVVAECIDTVDPTAEMELDLPENQVKNLEDAVIQTNSPVPLEIDTLSQNTTKNSLFNQYLVETLVTSFTGSFFAGSQSQQKENTSSINSILGSSN